MSTVFAQALGGVFSTHRHDPLRLTHALPSPHNRLRRHSTKIPPGRRKATKDQPPEAPRGPAASRGRNHRRSPTRVPAGRREGRYSRRLRRGGRAERSRDQPSRRGQPHAERSRQVRAVGSEHRDLRRRGRQRSGGSRRGGGITGWRGSCGGGIRRVASSGAREGHRRDGGAVREQETGGGREVGAAEGDGKGGESRGLANGGEDRGGDRQRARGGKLAAHGALKSRSVGREGVRKETWDHAPWRIVKLSNPTKGAWFLVTIYTACEPCDRPPPNLFAAPPHFVPKEDAQDAQEAALQDARLQAEGVAEIEEERATQIAAVAEGADPKKEAARIRERHVRDTVSSSVGMRFWNITSGVRCVVRVIVR